MVTFPGTLPEVYRRKEKKRVTGESDDDAGAERLTKAKVNRISPPKQL